MSEEKSAAIERVTSRHLTASRVKTAGEVRFIKDRGGDHAEWAWNPPGASERSIDPDYKFDARNLKPLAQTLRSALMALGHIQTARTTFTKIRSATISPDGNLGGRGYVLPVKDIRKQLSNCDEALSAITDCIYDEMQAVHWHPDVSDSGGNPRERGEVKQIMDDVDEIRESPEGWAAEEEAEMDEGGAGGSKQAGRSKQAAKLTHPLGVLPSGDYWIVPFIHGKSNAPTIAPSIQVAMRKAKEVSRMAGVDFVQIHDSLGGLTVTIQHGEIRSDIRAASRRVANRWITERMQ